MRSVPSNGRSDESQGNEAFNLCGNSQAEVVVKILPIPALTERDLARFLENITKRGVDECWEWQERGRRSHGYGRFSLAGMEFRAHRVSYFVATGNDPGELNVCHSCDNRPCCNPSHLFAATQSVNLLDSVRKGRFHRKGLRGVSNPASKLTDAVVLEIRKRYASEPLGRKRLGREYGVASSLIDRIVRGILWAHLPVFPVSPEVQQSKLQRIARRKPIP